MNKSGASSADENWPSKGQIDLKNICLKYRPNTDRILNGINIRIEAGHKVGIVGRTGAGKSTLFLALTRLVELESGSIEIDGIDIKDSVSLGKLRDKITMIPQDPTLFTGTLRYNLDPFDE